MIEHKLYVGADNKTGIVAKGRIVAIVGRAFDGFTVQKAIGAWKGKYEKSAVVTIITDNTDAAMIDIDLIVVALKRELEQEFVLWTSHEVKTNLS